MASRNDSMKRRGTGRGSGAVTLRRRRANPVMCTTTSSSTKFLIPTDSGACGKVKILVMRLGREKRCVYLVYFFVHTHVLCVCNIYFKDIVVCGVKNIRVGKDIIHINEPSPPGVPKSAHIQNQYSTFIKMKSKHTYIHLIQYLYNT